MLLAVEGLLPEPHNGKIMTLLFRLAEWHALAKLRMHTEHTLHHLDQATVAIGRELQAFSDWTQGLGAIKLPGETSTRQCHKSKKNASHGIGPSHLSASHDPPVQLDKEISREISQIGIAGPLHPPAPQKPQKSRKKDSQWSSPGPKNKFLNLVTYKMHALGDYVQTIWLFGTTDSYSTQIVCIQVLSVDYLTVIAQGELAHHLVKCFYLRTNKKDAIM